MVMKWEKSGHKQDLARAKGLGASGTGTEDWIRLRVSGIAIALLSLWFVWVLSNAVGADHATFTTLLAQPWNAVPMILISWASIVHARLGLNEIVEDYVQCKGLKLASLVWLYFFYVACGAVCVVSVLSILFTAGA
jgi:succinate dehydrogenase / fumarate reductase membrane anchor subunit